jgi:hypothetical protein
VSYDRPYPRSSVTHMHESTELQSLAAKCRQLGDARQTTAHEIP